MAKTVLVTGGARGIGRAVSELFAERGYRVIVQYNTSAGQAEEMMASFAAAGHRAAAVRADVGDPDSVRALFAEAKSIFGGVDILVCNAGIAQQRLFTDITDADWSRMLAVNLSGVFYCCREALAHMLHQKSGKIVTVSSIWGLAGAACEAHYAASKAGVIGLTKSLARELGPSGIQVNCVAPGVIETDMNASLDEETRCALCEETPLGRIGGTREVAESVYFLASPAADFITGQILSPNGGIVI